jgi:uncharacterized protein
VIELFINVSGILKEEGSSLDFQGEQIHEDIEFQGECVGFFAPVKLKGTISNTGQMLLAQISLEGCLKLQCGACTGIYEQRIDLSFEAVYKRFASPEDPDVFTYQNDRIDFKEAVLEFILLNLPTRKRCRENCLGLCPDCGVDLNLNQCLCQIL